MHRLQRIIGLPQLALCPVSLKLRLYSGQRGDKVDGLGNVVISAGLDRFRDIGAIRPGRHHNHWQPGGRMLFADAL
jgi:hypothetical protein